MSYQRSALDALDDASSALAIAYGTAAPQLVLAFVDGSFRAHTALLGRELERRHRGAIVLVVPVPSLGLPVPELELPRFVLHAVHAPTARFLPWRCDPKTGRLDFPLIPGPLGLLVFADAASLDVDRVAFELAARCEAMAGFALNDVPEAWPLAIGGDVLEGGAVGVYCDDPSFARAECIPMATAHGPTMIVTDGVAGVVQTLDGKPALTVLEEWARGLSEEDRASLAFGLDVDLDLRARGVHSTESDLARCRMVALDRERGAFLVEAATRPFQALRFATRNDARAVERAAASACRDAENALPLLLWPVEAAPMGHWPLALVEARARLAPWAIRGAVPLVGATHTSLPVHRHALGVLRWGPNFAEAPPTDAP